MINARIIAPITNSEYKVPVDIGGIIFSIKLDIGANYTVISIDAYAKDLTDKDKNSIVKYCEAHCNGKRRFQSASGDHFWGYPVIARNTTIGETTISEFNYYLVIENKRSVSLLGVDFLDNCKYTHDPHDCIFITEFDDDSYNKLSDHPIENTDLISLIDGLI